VYKENHREALVRIIDLHGCYFCRKERGTKEIGEFFKKGSYGK